MLSCIMFGGSGSIGFCFKSGRTGSDGVGSGTFGIIGGKVAIELTPGSG